MDKNVKLKKTVQKREDLDKVVKSQFTTFLQPEVEVDADTVEELFRLYDKLYLEIPLEGPKSHSYLIEESSKLVTIDQEQDITPLLQEITDLRERLLQANERISELENQTN
jgi:hypothetical protein